MTFSPTDTINQWFGKPQIVKKGLKWQIGKLVMTFYLLYLSFFFVPCLHICYWIFLPNLSTKLFSNFLNFSAYKVFCFVWSNPGIAVILSKVIPMYLNPFGHRLKTYVQCIECNNTQATAIVTSTWGTRRMGLGNNILQGHQSVFFLFPNPNIIVVSKNWNRKMSRFFYASERRQNNVKVVPESKLY